MTRAVLAARIYVLGRALGELSLQSSVDGEGSFMAAAAIRAEMRSLRTELELADQRERGRAQNLPLAVALAAVSVTASRRDVTP